MAEETYRLVYMQGETGNPPRLDHVSEILMTKTEAWEQMGTSWGLHILTGWRVSKCSCGRGFNADKDGVHRSEHVERIEDGIEDIALAMGLLQPASHRAGLVVA